MESIRYGPPLKLYDLSINAVAEACTSRRTAPCSSRNFHILPNTALVDLYEKLFQERRLCCLAKEFATLSIFNRLLYVECKWQFLMSCYQALLNHDRYLTQDLFDSFTEYNANHKQNASESIEMGLRIGTFLNDVGWYEYSVNFLDATEDILKNQDQMSQKILLQLLECYRLKLYAASLFCQFDKATEVFDSTRKLITEMAQLNINPCLAGTFCNFSIYHFVYSNIDLAYTWAIKALQLLSESRKISKRTILEVLRQASKVCVVKRKFIQAELLIQQAMKLGAIMHARDQLPTFSDVLLDYGYFLLNSDSVKESVAIYELAVEQRLKILDGNNIKIALAYEDLAYSLYLNEYSSGNFWMARQYTENSINIMQKILPKDHLLLASVKRVKALILEEVALDERSDEDAQKALLTQAEDLHLAALRLSQKSFGEKNIKTAKHYGNLGRLYQSMKEYEKAEEMHLKAIAIKEEIMGPNDHEVGLSIGHLASLYNYHMKKYSQAEELYFRSIESNIRLFGPAYSGLEYDYRGLLHICHKRGEVESSLFYNAKYSEWKDLRKNIAPINDSNDLLPLTEVVRRFFEIGEEQKRIAKERDLLVEEFRRHRKKENLLRVTLNGSNQ